jgi:hypothetical protein
MEYAKQCMSMRLGNARYSCMTARRQSSTPRRGLSACSAAVVRDSPPERRVRRLFLLAFRLHSLGCRWVQPDPDRRRPGAIGPRGHQTGDSQCWPLRAGSAVRFGSRMGAARLVQTTSDAVIVTVRRSLTWAEAVTLAVWPVAHRVRIEGVRGSNPLSSTQVKGWFRIWNPPFSDPRTARKYSNPSHRAASPAA